MNYVGPSSITVGNFKIKAITRVGCSLRQHVVSNGSILMILIEFGDIKSHMGALENFKKVYAVVIADTVT